MTILVTGAAGFIGYHVATRLLERGESVVGLDNFNDYYDPDLKRARAGRLAGHARFRMETAEIADAAQVARILTEARAHRVVHLAAQAGVRYGMQNALVYERSNVAGHLAVLEACRALPDFQHLVYASSSSVYGERSADGAFREDDPIATPASLYAATKRSAEIISGTYSGLFGLPQSALRLFTVYGPWGRPDMAYYGFTRKILAGEPIEVFGEGRMARDFTYIDDIVDGIVGVLDHAPQPGEHRLFNVGDHRPVGLMRMIEILEEALGQRAEKIFRPMQPGDVSRTFADISRLNALTGYRPKVLLEDGLVRFVEWYRQHHR